MANFSFTKLLFQYFYVSFVLSLKEKSSSHQIFNLYLVQNLFRSSLEFIIQNKKPNMKYLQRPLLIFQISLSLIILSNAFPQGMKSKWSNVPTLFSNIFLWKNLFKGAPVEACDTLLPRHVGTKPIDPSKAPYYLVQSINHYRDDYDHPPKGIKGIFFQLKWKI